MNYELHIQDVDNLEDELILHYAERETIRFVYEGGPDPTKAIVPSHCDFTLEVNDGADGKYDQYFTSNEKKWRVTMVISESQKVIGQWFLLPETYEEPYLNPLFYPAFEAVDGLGLLKGKTLTPDFYSAEKSVMEVIATCLKLTEIPFDIYLAPAIQSRVKENWKDIILNTEKYYDDKKLPSAYDFLYELVFTMQCQLFQCEGRWYIEGINRRHLPEVEFYHYDINGNYKGTLTITKNIKEFNHFLTATVSMLPALGQVDVLYNASELSFPENLYKQDPKGTAANGVDGSFLPEGWNFHNFQPKIQPNDYFLSLPGSDTGVYNPANYIALRDKKYVLRGTRIRFKIAVQFLRKDLQIDTSGDPMVESFENGLFVDILKYRIKLNDRDLYLNKDTNIQSPHRLELNAQGAGDTQFEFIVPQDGLLDLQIIEPYVKIMEIAAYAIEIRELSIERLGEAGEGVYQLEIDPESSVTSEVDLPIIPDINGNFKSFQLEKVKELNPDESTLVEIPIKYGREIDGKNYSIVSLEGAQLIERFPTEVTWRAYFIPVNNPKVHYNLNASNEMAIETEVLYKDASFFVNVRPYLPATIDRREWLKWTDAVYKVENKPYHQVVAEIRKRMFSTPRIRVEGVIDQPLKFNDLIRWEYKGKERFLSLSDLEWNPDGNEARFIMNEAFYDGAQAGNIPPYVFAGPDIIIEEEATATAITEAVVNSPFGNIETLLWEEVNGNGESNIITQNTLLPALENLTGNEYSFRLTAIDSSGNEASDEMKVFRAIEYAFSYDTFDTFYRPADNFTSGKRERSRVEFTPDLPEGVIVTLNFTAFIQVMEGELPIPFSRGRIEVFQNGADAFRISSSGLAYSENLYEAEFSLQYQAGDNIEIEFGSELVINEGAQVYFAVRLDGYTFTDGSSRTINYLAGLGGVDMLHSEL